MLECLKKSSVGVVECVSSDCLRAPDEEETNILLQRAESLGFPRMLGSIDCCKWKWKNCPTAYYGQYKGKEKVPTVTMEAICDDHLYFWHAFFGVAGCNNDITVLDASPLICKISSGEYPIACEYEINKARRNKRYWLADGIYPKYPSFVHSILNPRDRNKSYYVARQEGTRKDIERGFGVLQAKFHILTLPSRLWKKGEMETRIYCFLILHNMVVTDTRPLGPLEVSQSYNVLVGEKTEHCFVRKGTSIYRPIPGTKSTIINTNTYLNITSEYMKTQRLVFELICKERQCQDTYILWQPIMGAKDRAVLVYRSSLAARTALSGSETVSRYCSV